MSSASPNEATSPNETARDAERAEKKYAEKAEHSNVHALELLRRVAASAVRDASGASGFPRGGPGAWSRRLWGDLAALAGGAPAGAVSKEDAAAELVRAQLRCGNGAGSADFARRALAELFGTVRVSERVSERGAPTVTVTTAEAHDAVSNEERKNPAAPQLHGDGEDVNLGAAVRVVAGAAAGELVTAAGDRLRGAAAHSGAWSGTRAPAPEPAAPCPARSVARWGVWWEASAPASPSCTRGRTLRVWANTQTRAPTTRSPFLRDSERMGTGPRPLCPRAAPRRSSPRPRLSFCSPRRLLSGRTKTCGAPRRFWRASPNRSRRRDGATEREPTNRPGSRRAVRRTRNQSPRSARSRRRPEDWRPSGWTCRRASCDEKGWCSRSRAPRSRRRRARPSSSS